MTSKTTSQMLIDLGLAQSHSRPRVSNDSAFSESQFKTLKYRPDYPGFFEDVETAREWARETMGWYNTKHFHKGLRLIHPRDVHYGKADSNRQERQEVMQAAMERTPERFERGFVEAPGAPAKVEINPRSREVGAGTESDEQASVEGAGSSRPSIKPVARRDGPGPETTGARTDGHRVEL